MQTSTSAVESLGLVAGITFLLSAAIAISSAACTGMPTLPSATFTSMSIIGSPPAVGAASQYAASVLLASTSTVEDVTTLATWQSADTTIATVSKNGLVTGITAGSTNVTATYNGTSVTAPLTIP